MKQSDKLKKYLFRMSNAQPKPRSGNLMHLFPLLAKDSTLSVNTKLRIYKASIRSALTYAAPVWCSISNSNYQLLQVVQYKCLRVITNSPRNTPILRLHTSLGVDYIHTYVRQLATRFFTTINGEKFQVLVSIPLSLT